MTTLSVLCEAIVGKVVITIIRTYAQLITFPTFEERFKYLQMNGTVGRETFGWDRYLNQVFYKSPKWKAARDFVIMRDNGCDLGLEGYDIHGKVLVHHLNPITIEDIESENASLFDPNNLICVSHNTHNAIHYGGANLLPKAPITRSKNDTCPWKRD